MQAQPGRVKFSRSDSYQAPTPGTLGIPRPDRPIHAIVRSDQQATRLQYSLLSCRLGISHVNGVDRNFFMIFFGEAA